MVCFTSVYIVWTRVQGQKKSMNKKRMAVYFSGKIIKSRHHQFHQDSMKKFEKYYEKDYDVDYYCSINGVLDEDHKNMMEELGIRTSNFENIELNIIWEQLQRRGFSCSMFYNNKRNMDMIIDSQKQYDIIMKYRTEIIINQNCFDIPDNLENDTIYVPDGYDWGGINDQLAYGNQQSMVKYSSLYDKIERYCGQEGVHPHPETILSYHLKSEGLKIVRFCFPYNLFRL
jgi:hypothetical protein